MQKFAFFLTFLFLVFWSFLSLSTVFAMDPPVPTIDTLSVYQDSSRTIGAGTPICTGVSLTSDSACTGTLNEGSTYRFEISITTITSNFDITIHDFEDSVGTGDVLGSILTGDLLVGCFDSAASDNPGTPSIVSSVTARGNGYTAGNVCRVTTAAAATLYWIVTIDTDAIDGQATATFFVTNGTENDQSTVTTFNVAPPGASPRLELGTHRWFQNLDALEPGLSATLNTPIIAPAQGTGFRLRLNLHVLDADLGISGTTTKLQFGEKIGSICDPTGDETYSDVTTGSVIRFYDNAGVSDDTAINAHNFDPRHSSTTSGLDTINLQNYNDGTSNTNFTNAQSAINQDEDGLWDFSLQDFSAPAGTSYCFRPVQNGGGVIDDYGSSTLPEIRTRREIRVQLIGRVILRKVRLTGI